MGNGWHCNGLYNNVGDCRGEEFGCDCECCGCSLESGDRDGDGPRPWRECPCPTCVEAKLAQSLDALRLARVLDPDTLSSNLGIRPADVRAHVKQERHNEIMAKAKKRDPGNDILQPTPEQLILLEMLKVGPIHHKIVSEETRGNLDRLVVGGLAKMVETRPHPALGGPQDVVWTYALTDRGSHILKAALASPGDLEQLIAEAERWDSSGGIDVDSDWAKAVISLYALLLRRFMLRGNVTDLHIQAQFALDRFGT